jgi:hypothetical protein
MDGLQADVPSTSPAKRKKGDKGAPVSKVIELLDQPGATLGNPPADEPVDENGDDELPVTGRQRGSRNYTLAELTLLNECMNVAAPIGPTGVAEAINLYNRIAEERGWAIRREKPLRQKWDKVSNVYTSGCFEDLPLQRS